MVVQEDCEVGSEDGLDYLASLFQNSNYKSIMQVCILLLLLFIEPDFALSSNQ